MESNASGRLCGAPVEFYYIATCCCRLGPARSWLKTEALAHSLTRALAFVAGRPIWAHQRVSSQRLARLFKNVSHPVRLTRLQRNWPTEICFSRQWPPAFLPESKPKVADSSPSLRSTSSSQRSLIAKTQPTRIGGQRLEGIRPARIERTGRPLQLWR